MLPARRAPARRWYAVSPAPLAPGLPTIKLDGRYSKGGYLTVRMYEAVYILDPALEEAQQTALIERFNTLLEGQGARIEHLERWERRRLAYEVKGRREGYYVVTNFGGTT